MLSDFWPHGEIAERYGVFREDGQSERAIFLIDKEGVIRYIDIHEKDDQPENQILFDKLREINPENTISKKINDKEKEMPDGEIVMYCNDWCPDCKKARKWLEDRGVEYVEVNVDDYPQASDFIRKHANGDVVTPTFNIRGIIVVDFDKEALKNALSKD